ncbi:hypothetical protein F5I97DRAFT_1782586, partial [Phlebopus sp. FC_14]
YTNGWHPMEPWLTQDAQADVRPHRDRCDVDIKYFFIDFGLSTRFAPGEPHLVIGEKGAAYAPELLCENLYDPFKLDSSWTYSKLVVQAYDGMFLLDPLVKEMTVFRPDDYPTAKDALKMLQAL